MRLLDRIAVNGFRFYPDRLDSAVAEKLLEDLLKSQLVVADNVAQYFYGQRVNDFFTTADFPCVMLPFEDCFVEFRLPSQFQPMMGCEEVGMLLRVAKPYEGDEKNPNWVKILNLPGTKFNLECVVFIRPIGSKEVSLFAQNLLPIGGEGQIVSPGNSRLHCVTNLFIPGLTEEQEKGNYRFVHQYASFPVFLALSFMHCRNVKMTTEIPPKPLSKKHEKKTGRPLLRYHVLQIDHMKSVLEREGAASTGGLKKALHICRGHFATYGADGKGLLFGKLSGRYWVPMHTRGSATQGVVLKDYSVK